MEAIVGLFTGLSSVETRKDDDVVDRLSNKYSVLLLVVFAVVVSMHQYVGNPISCWAPADFTGNHETYMNAYCWVRNTYYIPFEDNLPKAGDSYQGKMLTYYQWIPFILLFQAILFYLPSFFWQSFNQKAGVDVDNILSYAQTFTKADKAGERKDTLLMIRNQMDRFLVTRRRISKSEWKQAIIRRGVVGRRFGGYLVFLYICTKMLYMANVVGQLLILDKLLAIDYGTYGIEMIQWLWGETDWTDSPQNAFPRVTMCNFHVRMVGNVHRHTVQCTLPINLYNEKIYMFLWFWMVFVASCTGFSLLMWIGRVIYPHDRYSYIRNYLKMLRQLKTETDNRNSYKFINEYLRLDGVLVLRLIGHNTNSLTVADIIGSLWDLWKERHKPVECSSVKCEEQPRQRQLAVISRLRSSSTSSNHTA